MKETLDGCKLAMATENTYDEVEYETWALVAKTTLLKQGLWDVVENGIPADPSKIPPEQLSEWRDQDMKAIEIMQSSLTDYAVKKTLSACSAKQVWDLLKKDNEEAKLGPNGEEEIAVSYLMSAKIPKDSSTYDEDMWMVTPFSTIHMTRYEKFFTALDRTHKDGVGLVDGTVLVVEGKGDVKVMMKDGKEKTINDVLFVPELTRNVLSFSQMQFRGCSFIEGGSGECIIRDESKAEFGETMWVRKELALRLRVIEGNLTS